MPAITGGTVAANGTSVTLTFDTAYTHTSGSATLTGAARIGMSLSVASGLSISANREFSTSGSPTAGDGTTSVTFDIEDGLAVWQDETITVSAGTLSGATGSGVATTNNAAYATNVACDGRPALRTRLSDMRWYEDDTLDVRVEAQGFAGSGDGVSTVTITASDGVNSDQVLTPSAPTAYTIPDGKTWRNYGGEIDLTALNRGDVDITIAVTGKEGLGTRSETVTITNTAGSLGTLPQTGTYYIKGTSGDNANTGADADNAIQGVSHALGDARTAGHDLVILKVAEAGTYDLNSGAYGSPIGAAPKIKIEATLDGVVIQEPTDQFMTVYANASTRFWWSSDSDSYSLKFLMTESGSSLLTGLRIDSYCDHRVRITNDTLATTTNGGNLYALATDRRFFFDGTTFENMRSVGQNSTSTAGSESQFWHTRFENITADPHNNATTVIDSRVTGRGKGEKAFTVSYTGAGSATIVRSGVASDITGTKELVLKVDESSVLTMDLTNASYDTVAEVVAAIDGLTDWSATADSTADSFTGADDIWPFGETEVTSTPLQIWHRDVQHGDLYQNNNGNNNQDIFISGIRCSTAEGLGEGAGANYGEQSFWFDHGNTPDYDRVVVRNCVDYQGIDVANQAPVPRSGFHSTMRNVLFIHNTMPDNRHAFVDRGGSGDYDGTNFVFAHNIVYDLRNEFDLTTPGTENLKGIDVFNNDFQSSGGYQQITGDGATTDNGTPQVKLTDWASASTFDPTPTDTDLIDRLDATNTVDYLGRLRSQSDAIGAAKKAEDLPTPVSVRSPTSVRIATSINQNTHLPQVF